MASISAMISFVVLLLVTFSSSAPLVPELQNATSSSQVENATNALPFDNLIVLARGVSQDSVGLSSASSEDDAETTVPTTEELAPREMEDVTTPSDDHNNHVERETDDQSNQVEREADDDSNKVEREADDEQTRSDEREFTANSFTTENTKRGIEVDSFESSTVDETSVAPSSGMKDLKRSLDTGSWLSDDDKEAVQKRSMEVATRSTVEETSVPSSSEAIDTRSAMEQASDEFNRRAIGPVEIQESSTVTDDHISSESTTDEQPFSPTEVSSTSDSETSVTRVEVFTRPSLPPRENKAKILAIIPGQISKSQLVINPATGKTAGFRPVHQVQLSQGANETVTEETKPHY